MNTKHHPRESGEAISDERIRDVFLANGFTIKDGQTDLKPYVYAAGRALLALTPPAAPSVAQKCWSCRKPYTYEQRLDADGMCPHCGVEIEVEPAPSVTAEAVACEKCFDCGDGPCVMNCSGMRPPVAKDQHESKPVSTTQWIERWYGSSPERGWSIVSENGRDVVAYLGPDVIREAVTQIVQAHNTALGVITDQPVAANPADLQGLKEKLLSLCPVSRDRDGMMYHPDLPDCDEGVRYDTLLSAFGIEAAFVGLENDAPVEVSERYFESGEADCSYWTPTPPVGDGWLLAAVYDTDNGPYAMFIREKRPEPKQSRRALAQRAAPVAAVTSNAGTRDFDSNDMQEQWDAGYKQGGVDKNTLDDLTTLVRRLVRELRKASPDNDLSQKAVDYLDRTGLKASVLRKDSAEGAREAAKS